MDRKLAIQSPRVSVISSKDIKQSQTIPQSAQLAQSPSQPKLQQDAQKEVNEQWKQMESDRRKLDKDFEVFVSPEEMVAHDKKFFQSLEEDSKKIQSELRTTSATETSANANERSTNTELRRTFAIANEIQKIKLRTT